MAHHKRKRAKNRRAGCLLCKPWKMNGFAKGRLDAEGFSDYNRRRNVELDIEEFEENALSRELRYESLL